MFNTKVPPPGEGRRRPCGSDGMRQKKSIPSGPPSGLAERQRRRRCFVEGAGDEVCQIVPGIEIDHPIPDLSIPEQALDPHSGQRVEAVIGWQFDTVGIGYSRPG